MLCAHFHLPRRSTDRDPIVRSRQLDGEAEAIASARQLVGDWPDCAVVEVRRAGELIERIRPPRN
jgi:hypothetical protein